MSDEHNNSPDRLEAMLRQWGAETAADEQAVPPPPRETSVWRLPWMWRYAVPAAALLFIALLTVWGPVRGMRRQDAASPPVAAHRDTQDDVERYRSELDDLRERHTAEVGALQADLDKVREQRDTLKIKADEAASRVEELTRAADDYRQDLVEQGRTRDDVARLEADLQVLEGKLAGLQFQLIEQARKADLMERQVAASQKLRVAILDEMRALYMAASAPRQSGLAAARTALAKNRVIERIQAVRNGTAPETVAALQKAETLLIRLAMVPEGDVRAGRDWTQAVRNSQVIADIDAALEASPPEAVLQLLLETRAIFTEVTHVG